MKNRKIIYTPVCFKTSGRYRRWYDAAPRDISFEKRITLEMKRVHGDSTTGMPLMTALFRNR